MARGKPQEMNLAEGVADAIQTLRMLRSYGRLLLAYSGGKDTLATLLVCREAGLQLAGAACEVSFFFTKQKEDVQRTASNLGLEVDWRETLTLDWLRRNRWAFFPPRTDLRSRTYQVRQQASMKAASRAGSYAGVIFGRRRQTNTIKSRIYEVDGILQCHPLYAWTTDMVWRYLEQWSIAKPWIYGTEVGRKDGNSPWFNLNPTHFGGIKRLASILEGMDPSLNMELLMSIDPTRFAD